MLFLVARNIGIQSYEISLYDVYPAYFWYLLLLDIFICQIILLINALFNLEVSWKAAYLGIIFSNSILILIPLIRRYSIYGSGDPLTHMGYILDIIQIGFIGHNMYPMDHILAAISYQISGLTVNILLQIYPLIFYMLYCIFIFVFFKSILNERPLILAGLILAPILFSGHGCISFAPQVQSNYFLSAILFLFFCRFLGKNGTIYSTLFIIICIFITFFHPLTSLFLIFSLMIFELSFYLLKFFTSNESAHLKTSSYLVLITAIVYFFWQSYATLLLGTFKRVFSWLNEESKGTSKFEVYSQLISEYNPDPIFLLKSFLFAYGEYLLFMAIGLISVFILLKAWREKKLYLNVYLLMFSALFLLSLTIYVFSQFIIKGVGYARIGHYAVLFSILLMPMAFEYIFTYSKNIQKFLIIALILALICIDYFSIFTLYLSPITKSAGQHVPDSQLIGIDTFFKIRSENFSIIEGGLSTSRLKDAIYGRSIQFNNVSYNYNPTIPAHFNYPLIDRFGDNFKDYTYMALSTLFRIYYLKSIPEYPDQWRFNDTDFFRLENDKSVSKIYSNKELDIYLLYPNTSNHI